VHQPFLLQAPRDPPRQLSTQVALWLIPLSSSRAVRSASLPRNGAPRFQPSLVENTARAPIASSYLLLAKLVSSCPALKRTAGLLDCLSRRPADSLNTFASWIFICATAFASLDVEGCRRTRSFALSSVCPHPADLLRGPERFRGSPRCAASPVTYSPARHFGVDWLPGYVVPQILAGPLPGLRRNWYNPTKDSRVLILDGRGAC
jgi:hypothetical protein